MNVKTAWGPLKWFLKLRGFTGITYPWGTYVLPGNETNEHLLAHEAIHAEQVARMGALKYMLTYLLYSIRYGYKDNPMEIEARQKSGYN